MSKQMMIRVDGESLEAFRELQDSTDAKDETTVIRNALRLHLTLLRAHNAGTEILMRKKGSDQCEPADLFQPV